MKNISKDNLIFLTSMLDEKYYNTVYEILSKFTEIEVLGDDELTEEERKTIRDIDNGKIKLVQHDLIEVL